MLRIFYQRAAAGISAGFAVLVLFAAGAAGQTAGSAGAATPQVKKIDGEEFARLLKPAGKPLLINFWATWCEPCREEFPDLVKLDAEYRGRIDFITITLDFEDELETGVPKFLAEMKATMPTYLLVTPDETAAIAAVSKEWAGGLPFTVLYAQDGSIAYLRQGLIKLEKVREEIDKLSPK